ncbi:hypothetical protein O0555_21630 [Brevibacillus laterosporus]|uniref:hypothetical protein n=1 Tax=Brevibacillus laterosporus TaxID=1465 RepID=UPI0018CF5964|nr:hypothetical protein [Brevibacillus laterosporus]MBG9797130.1 hypothetical protein [Brevibacillus laterosporus]MCR8939906.1 hypothetical protein [Brevibacillus laterosporus]MCZ0842546.1 hypothetical protein [Brevibacillus laterosporus]MCZ0847570.1 hypothetical protein [Brevibacillus laterosporus]MED1909568.1 hypothetical protein [Brevibacillus laterosporus]
MAGLVINSSFKMVSSQLAFGIGKSVLLIGKSSKAVPLQRASVLSESLASVGADSNLGRMIEAAMLQRCKTVYYIGLGTTIPSDKPYKKALIEGSKEGAYFAVVDDASEAILPEIKEYLDFCFANAIRGVVLAGGGTKEVEKANHYRIWITEDNLADRGGNPLPACVSAAALAGALTNESDLSLPFGGVVVRGYTLKEFKHVDSIRTTTEAGVLCFQQVGTDLQVYQGTTSYVDPAPNEDALKDPEVVCTVDEVVQTVEKVIFSKHNRTKISRLPDIKDTVYTVLSDTFAKQEKIYPPDAERIVAVPDPEKRGKANLRYHFNVVPGLKELEVSVTGEVTAQNS